MVVCEEFLIGYHTTPSLLYSLYCYSWNLFWLHILWNCEINRTPYTSYVHNNIYFTDIIITGVSTMTISTFEKPVPLNVSSCPPLKKLFKKISVYHTVSNTPDIRYLILKKSKNKMIMWKFNLVIVLWKTQIEIQRTG